MTRPEQQIEHNPTPMECLGVVCIPVPQLNMRTRVEREYWLFGWCRACYFRGSVVSAICFSEVRQSWDLDLLVCRRNSTMLPYLSVLESC